MSAPHPELPAMLYKTGSAFEWDGEGVDYLVVEDADDLTTALKDGWSVGKPEKKAATQAKADDAEPKPKPEKKPNGRGRGKRAASVPAETPVVETPNEAPPVGDATAKAD